MYFALIFSILQPVCGTISLGNLFMECVRHALLLCRFQWLSVVGALSEKSGMELEVKDGALLWQSIEIDESKKSV